MNELGQQLEDMTVERRIGALHFTLRNIPRKHIEEYLTVPREVADGFLKIIQENGLNENETPYCS